MTVPTFLIYGEETTMTKDGKMLYNLLLEYASGGIRADLIKRSGRCGLPESDMKRYARSILEGIGYIHSHDYVHCDLKPDNVQLVPSGDGEFAPRLGILDWPRNEMLSDEDANSATQEVFIAAHLQVSYLRPKKVLSIGLEDANSAMGLEEVHH
ncbi:hypothetical protein GH714_017494 [Hevea brasiliensis]|uniref:Protein kinase domain-containing protein n=1 Tax=Hevea brasiliensis TaxID=3981 RepID=A0A6A6L6U7_HEVBR|nr:hypothetical protein GH714_017494 [Hevea brasiliensis]